MRIAILATLLAAATSSTPSSKEELRPLAVRPVSEAASLAREAGHGRPAVLHFWATWCGACRDEFPRIRKLLNRLPARNVGVLLVSIDRPDKLEEVKRDLPRSCSMRPTPSRSSRRSASPPGTARSLRRSCSTRRES